MAAEQVHHSVHATRPDGEPVLVELRFSSSEVIDGELVEWYVGRVTLGDGETREQLVACVNFYPRWEDTVRRRAKKFARDRLTPQLLVPQYRLP
jgi:hypothetical protein